MAIARSQTKRSDGLADPFVSPMPPEKAAPIPLTPVSEPTTEMAKYEKKKNITITAQAALTTINAILPIAAPAAGFAGFPVALAPQDEQNFAPSSISFPHFPQKAIISLLSVFKGANANDVGVAKQVGGTLFFRFFT
jgi:hypothetical protein